MLFKTNTVGIGNANTTTTTKKAYNMTIFINESSTNYEIKIIRIVTERIPSMYNVYSFSTSCCKSVYTRVYVYVYLCFEFVCMQQ